MLIIKTSFILRAMCAGRRYGTHLPEEYMPCWQKKGIFTWSHVFLQAEGHDLMQEEIAQAMIETISAARNQRLQRKGEAEEATYNEYRSVFTPSSMVHCTLVVTYVL